MSSTTDVLKADRISIEDRIYRLLPVKESLKNSEEENFVKITHFDEDEVDPDVPVTHQGDRFISTIYVPSDLIGFVVGTKYKNVEALKSQYGVKINIPDKRNIEAGITIQGSTKRNVSTTYKVIQNKIFYARMKLDSTHFVSFPVNSSTIQESFLNFKDGILKKYKGIRGVDPSIFQKPAKLHVTVTVLVLLDERDKQKSIAILNNCTDSFIKDLGDKEIIVHVKGLEIMNDDPSEVDVLYAKLYELNDDNRLQILADKIMTEFVNATLSKDKYDQVKLHITLMNTIFRDRLENNNSDERITFDASRIMKEYKDYDFGEIVISEIHISARYTEASDGYYNYIHKIKLN